MSLSRLNLNSYREQLSLTFVYVAGGWHSITPGPELIPGSDPGTAQFSRNSVGISTDTGNFLLAVVKGQSGRGPCRSGGHGGSADITVV
ncbi:hypothetical protein ElyMa_006448900 [Elysia marginata]|uniref:Uncharacterized protein n=1 Tax=Elysia marginata TaxID=1093978 RepID=A0AAV4I0V6_9GAST|nr:hypothetical protein ElyMa_006448900 [Elysia marginata]